MLVNTFEALAAAAVVLAALTVGAAAAGQLRPRAPALLAVLVGIVAAAAWVFVVLDPDRELAVAATGITGAAVALAGAAALARALQRARANERLLDGARTTIEATIAEEAELRTAELQQLLARTRADSISLLADEERRIAEERRREFSERERSAGQELAEALASVERRVQERLRGWSDDLDRAQSALEAQLGKLEQRQKQLIAEAEARIEAEAAELVTTSETQRASVLRLREDLERSAQAAVAEALDELQAHTGERRRVIEEIADRLRRREEALAEQIERGEVEATRRIESSFADVERRQVEQLQRVVAREGERFAEAAAQQFDVTLRTSREEAAARLSRELDRAVETFVRQADAVFAERLAHTGDSGQKRIEARLRQSQTAFERQREELTEAFARRIADADADLRRTLGSLVAEAEAERAALEARLGDLARKIDDLHAGLRRG